MNFCLLVVCPRINNRMQKKEHQAHQILWQHNIFPQDYYAPQLLRFFYIEGSKIIKDVCQTDVQQKQVGRVYIPTQQTQRFPVRRVEALRAHYVQCGDVTPPK